MPTTPEDAEPPPATAVAVATPTASPRAVPPTPVVSYPTALTARPLVLPANGLEGGVRLLTTRYESGDDRFMFHNLEARGRGALGTTEVEAALVMFVYQQFPESFGDVPDPDRLQSIFLAARHGLDPDQTVGLELDVAGLTSEFTTVRGLAVYHRKAHLSPRAAIDSAVGLGYQRSSSSQTVPSQTWSYVVVETRHRIQAQLTPTVALEGRAALRFLRDNGSPSEMTFTTGSAIGFDVGVGVTAAVAPTIDVIAAFDVLDGGDLGAKLFTIGVMTRRVP